MSELGKNINDPSDDTIFTFYFDPNEITYPSSDLAVVPVWTWFCSGEKLRLELCLVKIEGEWFLEELKMVTLDLAQAVNTGGPVPCSALWPMARDNRWQFMEILATPSSTVRTGVSSRINPMILNASHVSFRTLMIGSDPTPGVGGRQTFRLEMSSFGTELATNQVALPIDPGAFEFGRLTNGISAVDRGFFPLPSNAVNGISLWDILDPSHHGFVRAFEESGLFLQGADTGFNGGHPWRLADLLVQEGAAATQSVSLSLPGSSTRLGEARILVMGTVPVSLPWISGLARRFDISLSWNDSPEVTWSSLVFFPGMGLVGYADYDLTTRHPIRFAWLWGASVGNREFLPPGDTGALDPFVTLAINPVGLKTWTAGTPFKQGLIASGGLSPYTWSLVNAPEWVVIAAGAGTLGGTPVLAGSYSFEVAVHDAGDRVARLPVWISVASAPAPVVSAITPTQGFQGGSPVPVEVTGSNFYGMPQLRLATVTERGPVATELKLLDAGRLSGVLSLTGIATGLWSIEVVNPDGQVATGVNLFRVRPAVGSVPVTLIQAAGQADPTNASVIHFTVVFGWAMSGFTAGDVSLARTAAPANCTVTEVAPMNGTTYDVAVSGLTRDGNIRASIPANVAQDPEDNWNQSSTGTDNQVTRDTQAPAVTIQQASGQADPTNATSIIFDVVFSKPVTGFTGTDVTLSGTAGATTATVNGTGATYTVTVTGMSGSGTVIANLSAGAAMDALGYPSLTGTGTDRQVSWDGISPTVTINQASGQPDPTNGSSVLFTVVFSEPVTGFTGADVSLSGTTEPTTATVSGTGPTYTVTVTGMTGEGTIIAGINAGVTSDALGNQNLGGTFTDNQVTRDITPPSIVTALGDGVNPYTVISSPLSVTFSEPVNSTSQITAPAAIREVTGSTNTTSSWDGPRTVLTFMVSVPLTVDSDIATNVTDLAGNVANLTMIDTGPDSTPPTVTTLGDGVNPISVTWGGPIDIVFSEALGETSKTDVQNALSAAKTGGGSLHFVWIGGTLSVEPNSGTAVWNSGLFVANVTDRAGNNGGTLQVFANIIP